METETLFKKIESFLHNPARHPVGILVTSDAEGRPHAAFMGSVASPARDQLLTLTGPDSQKVVNILENPHVEWLFTDDAQEELLYVRGTAKVVQEPAEVAKAWKELPERSREHFLSYKSIGMEFLIFETMIESFELRIPRQNAVHRLEITQLRRSAA